MYTRIIVTRDTKWYRINNGRIKVAHNCTELSCKYRDKFLPLYKSLQHVLLKVSGIDWSCASITRKEKERENEWWQDSSVWCKWRYIITINNDEIDTKLIDRLANPLFFTDFQFTQTIGGASMRVHSSVHIRDNPLIHRITILECVLPRAAVITLEKSRYRNIAISNVFFFFTNNTSVYYISIYISFFLPQHRLKLQYCANERLMIYLL